MPSDNGFGFGKSFIKRCGIQQKMLKEMVRMKAAGMFLKAMGKTVVAGPMHAGKLLSKYPKIVFSGKKKR